MLSIVHARFQQFTLLWAFSSPVHYDLHLAGVTLIECKRSLIVDALVACYPECGMHEACNPDKLQHDVTK